MGESGALRQNEQVACVVAWGNYGAFAAATRWRDSVRVVVWNAQRANTAASCFSVPGQGILTNVELFQEQSVVVLGWASGEAAPMRAYDLLGNEVWTDRLQPGCSFRAFRGQPAVLWVSSDHDMLVCARTGKLLAKRSGRVDVWADRDAVGPDEPIFYHRPGVVGVRSGFRGKRIWERPGFVVGGGAVVTGGCVAWVEASTVRVCSLKTGVEEDRLETGLRLAGSIGGSCSDGWTVAGWDRTVGDMHAVRAAGALPTQELASWSRDSFELVFMSRDGKNGITRRGEVWDLDSGRMTGAVPWDSCGGAAGA